MSGCISEVRGEGWGWVSAMVWSRMVSAGWADGPGMVLVVDVSLAWVEVGVESVCEGVSAGSVIGVVFGRGSGWWQS